MRAALKNNIPVFRSRMSRVAWSIKADYKEKATNALEKSASNLRRTTPKNTGKMSNGWKARVIGGSPKGRVPIAGWVFNRWAEGSRWRYGARDFAARFTNLETGRINTRRTKVHTDGRTVLRVLEFGAAPHTIRAAHVTKDGKPGFLRFVSRNWGTGSTRAGSQIGSEQEVFVREVQHPGSKPHGMIRTERAVFRKRIKRINTEVDKVAQRVIDGREK